MISNFYNNNIKTIRNIILLGIPFIFIMACLFHFLYVATGKTLVSAIVFPTNESIFEHLKLMLYPTIIYWLVSYIIASRDYDINFGKWLISCIVSFIASILFVLSFHYILKGAFNFTSAFIDILSVLIGAVIGQLISLHIYKNANYTKVKFFIAILVLASIIALFTYLTFNPLHVPLFLDSSTGLYGIQ